ncbi:MAG: hypothetical protein KAW12_27120 [Candidatus Aminicenantes bacterium]|nr:hypothetical protein [Candidatus Aminicenantes bacterium]
MGFDLKNLSPVIADRKAISGICRKGTGKKSATIGKNRANVSIIEK